MAKTLVAGAAYSWTRLVAPSLMVAHRQEGGCVAGLLLLSKLWLKGHVGTIFGGAC